MATLVPTNGDPGAYKWRPWCLPMATLLPTNGDHRLLRSLACAISVDQATARFTGGSISKLACISK
eukprot:2559141-Amphidinium_carterae.1